MQTSYIKIVRKLQIESMKSHKKDSITSQHASFSNEEAFFCGKTSAKKPITAEEPSSSIRKDYSFLMSDIETPKQWAPNRRWFGDFTGLFFPKDKIDDVREVNRTNNKQFIIDSHKRAHQSDDRDTIVRRQTRNEVTLREIRRESGEVFLLDLERIIFLKHPQQSQSEKVCANFQSTSRAYDHLLNSHLIEKCNQSLKFLTRDINSTKKGEVAEKVLHIFDKLDHLKETNTKLQKEILTQFEGAKNLDVELGRKEEANKGPKVKSKLSFVVKIYVDGAYVKNFGPFYKQETFDIPVNARIFLKLEKSKKHLVSIKVVEHSSGSNEDTMDIIIPYSPYVHDTIPSEWLYFSINKSDDPKEGYLKHKIGFLSIGRQDSDDRFFESSEFGPNKDTRPKLRNSLINIEPKDESRPFSGAEFFTSIQTDRDEPEILTRSRRYSKTSIHLDPIDIQRRNGTLYLEKVNDIVLQFKKETNVKKQNIGLILQSKISSFWSLSTNFFNNIYVERPFKPNRRDSDEIRKADHPQINLCILRATNLPQKQQQAKRFNKDETEIFVNENLRPFIEITWMDHKFRTLSAKGANPVWNEKFTIPITASSDYLTSNLIFNIYDECTEEIPDEDEHELNEIHQCFIGKWLGEFRLPLYSLLDRRVLEGNFEIESPLVIFGYSMNENDVGEALMSEEIARKSGNSSKKASISLYASLDGQRSVEESDPLHRSELIWNPNVEPKSIQRLIQYNQDFPSRRLLIHGTLLSGQHVYLTQLIGSLKPPSIDFEDQEKALLRFVSLIPVFNEEKSKNLNLNGIWLTNEEVFTLMSCMKHDLATLLASFYKSLGIETWLILGESLLDGLGCYILIKKQNSFYVIDPSRNKMKSSKDVNCILKRVFCIIDEHNVWANIQVEDQPSLINFEYKNSSEWIPLIDSHKIETPQSMLHSENFQYEISYPSSSLQKTIELKLMKKFTSWRRRKTTIWNRLYKDTIRSGMQKLEREKIYERNSEEYFRNISSMFWNYKVDGYLLNAGYTRISAIVKMLKKTNVHLTSNPKTEFCLIVHIHTYPCNVFSVWVLIISLIPIIGKDNTEKN